MSRSIKIRTAEAPHKTFELRGLSVSLEHLNLETRNIIVVNS